MKVRILLFIFATSIFFISCKNEKYQVLEGYTQGTTFRIVYKSASAYNIEVYELLDKFDKSLSTYQDSSIISLINKNVPDIVIDDIFKTFFEKSKFAYEKTDGYFDITVGPLVKAWGFGVVKEFDRDSSSIDSLKEFIGMDKIRIENNKLFKDDPRIYLDGNAIAQGQSVDYIADFFNAQNVESYLIEIGGEVRTKGVNKEGKAWKIGIDKPIEGAEERELQAIVSLSDKALATSGNYRKFYEFNGVKYSHSISPKTGYPVRDKILSATIIADECSIADAYATACMVMGFDKAKEFVENTPEIEAYFIYSNESGGFETYHTAGFKSLLDETLTEKS
jgi:thiamine biosynthesis lipoprotein